MMQKPQQPTSLFKFLTVLDDVVWVCIVLAYFVTSCIIYLLDKYSPYSYQNNPTKYEEDELEQRVFDFRESLWFCITCVIPQVIKSFQGGIGGGGMGGGVLVWSG